MKRVLLVAYHFPPLAGSSGVQRTLRFVQELPAMGWQPLVLSTDTRAYERTSGDLMGEIPEDVIVRRAFALDSARHLSVLGRFPGFLSRPDRWVTWWVDAVRIGMRMIRQYEPHAVWSTYPIATAHSIGAALAARSGLPWIADFRDPMVQPDYPLDVAQRRSFTVVEQRAFERAARCVLTTPSALRTYAMRYPASASRLALIENGYDERSFAGLDAGGSSGTVPHEGALTLLHSGIVYPSERDPSQLFQALQSLAQQGVIKPGEFVVRFRASVHDALVNQLAASRGVAPFVETCPAIPYRDALREMMGADGLLVMQASNCNEQIPAKVYEYLRARRPIVCLSDPEGDTVAVLRSAGVTAIAPLDSASGIATTLAEWLTDLRTGRATLADPAAVAQASRQGRAKQLVTLLEQITTSSTSCLR